MKYLITGHNGYIGQNYIHHLQETHPHVTIAGISNSGESIKGVKNYHMELSDKSLLNLLTEINPKVIIHLASQRFGSLHDLINNNVLATENLFEAAIKLNKPNLRILVIGSSSEIGNPASSLANETEVGTPVDNYGLSKLLQSTLAAKYAYTTNMNIIRIRFFNILGKEMPHTLLAGRAVNLFAKQLANPATKVEFGDLSSLRDYTDIRDICTAIDAAVINGKSGELYHISNGQSVSGSYLIKTIIDQCPDPQKSNLKYISNPEFKSIVHQQVGDNSKAKYVLKWEPKYTLPESVQSIWQNYI